MSTNVKQKSKYIRKPDLMFTEHVLYLSLASKQQQLY